METEIEARQRQTPESLRGVHEQVIKLVDNMVQNYLGNLRRAVQRMSNFIDNRRANLTSSQPRASSELIDLDSTSVSIVVDFPATRLSILRGIQSVSRSMHNFAIRWARVVGKQQSPLIDRIPQRGVELWRDFWDTMRQQVRRINQEFWQLSQDMARMLTGRQPAGSTRTEQPNLLYSASESDQASLNELVQKRFQDFYEKMGSALEEQQRKMDEALTAYRTGVDPKAELSKQDQTNNLIDEQDDQVTRDELNRNTALRQQIQQEINVFSSIFDIMRTFIERLRESASNVVRDVLRPGASNNNNNDPVTPGPSVKPQVDQLLGETINSQRNINSQSKPVLLPNNRPVNNPQ